MYVYCEYCGKQINTDTDRYFNEWFDTKYFCDRNNCYSKYRDKLQKERFEAQFKNSSSKSSGDAYPPEQFTGYKEQKFPDGSLYIGEFVNGKMHGKGKWVFADGTSYVGDWVNNQRTGKGSLTFADGNYYDGDFVAGAFHGYGKLTFADGSVYVGQFSKNNFDGKGKIIYTDGEVKEGYFENGKFVGVDKPDSFDDSGEIDVSPELLRKFMNEGAVPSTAPTAAKASDREIWDKLVSLSVAQRNEFLASHPDITVPSGVDKIESKMFSNCLNLRSIRFNDDLREIGASAFIDCKNLGPVLVIPQSVEKVCKSAFSCCHGVKKIIMPNNIHVEEYGFMCGVTDVEFETDPPKGVVIEKGTFSCCDMIMSKEMKKKIKDLNSKAFK